MDETETVLACGAGGVTKLKNRIPKIFHEFLTSNIRMNISAVTRRFSNERRASRSNMSNFASGYIKYINHLEQINDAAPSNPQVMIDEVEDSYHEHIENIAPTLRRITKPRRCVCWRGRPPAGRRPRRIYCSASSASSVCTPRLSRLTIFTLNPGNAGAAERRKGL